MSERLDSSFLEDALKYSSTEARQWVADALACHLHNTGYQLDGNTEANDVAWFARALHNNETGGTDRHWETLNDEARERFERTARTVLRVLPDFQLRVAHRLIELSKVVRDIERAARKELQAFGVRGVGEP